MLMSIKKYPETPVEGYYDIPVKISHHLVTGIKLLICLHVCCILNIYGLLDHLFRKQYCRIYVSPGKNNLKDNEFKTNGKSMQLLRMQ